MDIIDRINCLLAAKGVTGAEMSRDLGLSNSAYSQWNTRKTKPSKRSIAEMARYLGTTAEYLLWGDAEKKAPRSDEVLEGVDIAFYGDFKQLSEEQKDTVRDMVRVMRERRKQQE